MAEASGHTTRVPSVFIPEVGPPQAPPSADSLALWQNTDPAGRPPHVHVAISIGDGGTMEAIEVLGSPPPVFAFLL